MNSDDQRLADQVRTIQTALVDAGWIVANALGELVTPDGVLWFTATYTHGEYTVETSYRPRGAGPAEGAKRVRLTPALISARPEIARELADELIQAGWSVESARSAGTDIRAAIETELWPPEAWGKFAA